MKEKLILVGGGGHCKSCIEVIESTGKYEIIGVLDLPSKIGEKVLNYEVIGDDRDIQKYIDKGITHFHITLGQIQSAELRKKMYNNIVKSGGVLPTIVSKHAVVSKRSKIGAGTIVMHGAIVNADVEIGNNCIINTYANVEHDIKIGDNVHVSTGACINGQVNIGDECLIGSNSVIRNLINITNNVVVGVGSVVVKDITDSGTYVGNPLKRVK